MKFYNLEGSLIGYLGPKFITNMEANTAFHEGNF